MQRSFIRLFVLSAAWAAGAAPSFAQEPTAASDAPERAAREIALSNWLVIEPVGRYGRAAVHVDAIEARIVAGRWSAPKAGDTVALPDGSTRTWQAAPPDKDGWLDHAALRGGYACASANVDAARVMLLDASGHSTVYVNGQPRAGDPYRTGWVRLPVMLRPGTNTFLFHCSRGRVRANLIDPASNLVFSPGDATLPDLIVAEAVNARAAITVINTTTEPVANLQIKASYDGGETTITAAPVIPPLSLRKVGFRLSGPAPTESGPVDAQLDMFLSAQPATRLDTVKISLAVRDVGDRYKRTFISEIDGSVQYYAVTPAQPPPDGAARPALFLTLHGAGVEATGQAAAYQSKDWGHIVAPTNRRPFGFDWEDWGRLDAMEVLALAARELNTDPPRTYLTGHSMGGHGVWHVGATFPDRFAAIAPSAGWISFWSYAGAHKYEGESPVERLLHRATTPSDTLALSRNYLHHGVYILHGERDDNVPVDQARKMRAHLGTYHCDFAYYEKPGAGHWWTNACVDWPPLFDFLRRHTSPSPHDVRHVEFATANPAVSATSRWAVIEAQIHPLSVSSIKLSLDAKARKFSGTTDNVARMALDLSELSRPRHRDTEGEQTDATVLPAGEALTVELDGTTLENIPWPEHETRLWLTHSGTWSVSKKPSPSLKGPHRYGPFKQAFRNRFLLVYATKGSALENAWSFAKARYDAETFWYRGNGAVDVIADNEFNPDEDRDRNVILYGNAAANGAWAALLAGSPVQVRPNGLRIARRELSGDDLACLTIRLRPGSDRALVGAVAGTGLAGMRLTDRLPYFVSGVAYPDCIVVGPDVLTDGGRGVRVAGYFGIDWTVESGQFAWRDE